MSLVKRAAVEFDTDGIDHLVDNLARAEQSLEIVSTGLREFREAVGVSQAQVAAATRVLTHRLAAVERNHPDVKLTLDEGVSIVGWMSAVADGSFDVSRYTAEAPRARKPKDPEPEPEIAAEEPPATPPPALVG